MKHPLDHDDANKVRLWLDHLTMGTTGEQMLAITREAEAAIGRYRERLEASSTAASSARHRS